MADGEQKGKALDPSGPKYIGKSPPKPFVEEHTCLKRHSVVAKSLWGPGLITQPAIIRGRSIVAQGPEQ